MSGTQLSSPHISTSFKAQKPGEMKWLGYVGIGHIWALIGHIPGSSRFVLFAMRHMGGWSVDVSSLSLRRPHCCCLSARDWQEQQFVEPPQVNVVMSDLCVSIIPP